MKLCPRNNLYPSKFKYQKINPDHSNNNLVYFSGYDRGIQSAEEILSSVLSRLLESLHRPATGRMYSKNIYSPINQSFLHLGEYRLQADNGIKDFALLRLGKDTYELQKKHKVDINNNPLQINILRLNPNKIEFYSIDRPNNNQGWSKPFFNLVTEDKIIINGFYNFISSMKKLN